MFSNNNKDKQDDIQPMSTKPVNHGLLGIDDDSQISSNASGMISSAPPVAPLTPNSATNSGSLAGSNHDSALSASSLTNPTADNDTPLSTNSTSYNASSTTDDSLLHIKKEALEELSPLIDHLDQDPEERFKTTMMMIQASDNKDLIPQAFTAAKAITDDKKRAQALLDIVNEVNYFTHKTED